MSKAYWNGVLSRLPDFCRNMGKTAMMGAMMAEYNSHGHHHHHHCCGPSIWGCGPGMGGGYYWNNMAGMGGMYPMGYYGGYQGAYMNPGMAQSGSYGNSQIISPDYVRARMGAIYSSDVSQKNQNQAATTQNTQNQSTQSTNNNTTTTTTDLQDMDEE